MAVTIHRTIFSPRLDHDIFLQRVLKNFALLLRVSVPTCIITNNALYNAYN